jgi:hypothetical protein
MYAVRMQRPRLTTRLAQWMCRELETGKRYDGMVCTIMASRHSTG